MEQHLFYFSWGQYPKQNSHSHITIVGHNYTFTSQVVSLEWMFSWTRDQITICPRPGIIDILTDLSLWMPRAKSRIEKLQLSDSYFNSVLTLFCLSYLLVYACKYIELPDLNISTQHPKHHGLLWQKPLLFSYLDFLNLILSSYIGLIPLISPIGTRFYLRHCRFPDSAEKVFLCRHF